MSTLHAAPDPVPGDAAPDTAALETTGLAKRFGRKWALSDCSLRIPQGRVVGLVGPNGAGKSTLLHLAVGLLRPDGGSIRVFGGRPGADATQLARVGFVAQDTPVYPGASVADHLRFGAWTNSRWDADLAGGRLDDLGLDRRKKAGELSGGQRAQLALTLAVAKRPDLLILDEPVASLDPLARREFLAGLMEIVAEHGTSVILSSHLVTDLQRVCDYLVVLVDSSVRLVGDIDDLLAAHRRLVGPRRDPSRLPTGIHVVEQTGTDRQATLIARVDGPIIDPAWTETPIGLEDLVLAYLANAEGAGRHTARRAAS